MKQRTFLALLITIMLPLLVLPLLDAVKLTPAGRIRIPAAGIDAVAYTADHGPDCGCCGALWNGGQVYITEDTSAVCIDDAAYLTTTDGDRFVLECVQVVSCIRLGCWLIGWRGVMHAEGDVLLYTDADRWPFVRVLRLARL